MGYFLWRSTGQAIYILWSMNSCDGGRYLMQGSHNISSKSDVRRNYIPCSDCTTKLATFYNSMAVVKNNRLVVLEFNYFERTMNFPHFLDRIRKLWII